MTAEYNERGEVLNENIPWPCGTKELITATEQFADAVHMPAVYFWTFVPQLLRLLYNLEPHQEPEPPP